MIAAHVPHFVAFWRWSKGKRLAALAALFSAGEAVVMSGIPLPFSDRISPVARVGLIFGIVGVAFYLRWRANRENRRV